MNRQALHIDELSAELAGCKQQLAYYKSILESPEGIIVFSLDREYRYTSFTSRHASVMQEIWGQSIAVGRSILEIITADDDRLKAQQNFDAALELTHTVLVRASHQMLHSRIHFFLKVHCQCAASPDIEHLDNYGAVDLY